jgi:hypothetical protein
MKRRLRILLTVVSVLTLTVAVAFPVQAQPPIRFDHPDFFALVHDFENGKVLFWNITRDGYCSWEDGLPPIVDRVPFTGHETGQGDAFASYTATRPLELWNIDNGGVEFDPCSSTDTETAPWATGGARAQLRDYVPASGADRPFEFSTVVHLEGTVMDTFGDDWRYSFNGTVLIDGETTLALVEKFNLKKLGK